MPGKAKRPPGGNEKKQLRNEIETKKGELRRLQEKFREDSDRLKNMQSTADTWQKCIDELRSSNITLENQLRAAEATRGKVIADIKLRHEEAQRVNQQRLQEALLRRSNSAQQVSEMNSELNQCQQRIRSELMRYRSLLHSRSREIDEATATLKNLEEKEMRLFSNLGREHGPPFGFMPSLDDYEFESCRAPELSESIPSPIARDVSQLRVEEDKLKMLIETFKQLTEKLNGQIQSLAREETLPVD